LDIVPRYLMIVVEPDRDIHIEIMIR